MNYWLDLFSGTTWNEFRKAWHGNPHTFASRLVMAGVDPRTVQELGGWRTLAMAQRYSHLDPGHLMAAVERLVPVQEATKATELGRN